MLDDLIEQIYFLISEALPAVHYPDPAYQALLATLTPEQSKLFDAFYLEFLDEENHERLRLFRCLVKLGLHIP